MLSHRAFVARRYASAVYAMAPCLSTHPSVRPRKSLFYQNG